MPRCSGGAGLKLGPPGLMLFSVGDTAVVAEVVVVVVVVGVGVGDCPLLLQLASSALEAMSALKPNVALRRRTVCEFIVADAMPCSAAVSGEFSRKL